MTLAAESALTAMAQLVRTVPEQQHVSEGAFEAPPNAIAAYVEVGDSDVQLESSGGVYRDTFDLEVTFAYAVAGAEQDSERRLARAKSEFDRRVLQNRLGSVSGNGVTVAAMLNGTVESMDPPSPMAGMPKYAMFAGVEHRISPRAVRCTQRETISS